MKQIAPYQILFPLGILSSLLAVTVWLLRDLHLFETPELLIHSRLIIGGFLWSFITGFLMTAVPRLTGAKSASSVEKILATVLILLSMASAWRIDNAFYILEMALIIFLAAFAGRRILTMSKKPPVFISHIALALLMAFFGSLTYYQGNAYLGFHLFYLGSVLLLILGLGTRFFSFLSGLPSEFENAKPAVWGWVFHLLGLTACLLLYAAGKGWHDAYLGIAFLSLFYLFGVWKVQRPSQRPSALRWAVRVVAFVIPLSFVLSFFWPVYYVTWFHFIFIGCFALMTFSVATRVTLAHGSYPLEHEMTSKTLWVFLGLLLVTLISRIFYGFTEGNVQKSFLHLAATFWILAVLVWCSSFFIRIFRKGPQAAPSCKDGK